MARRTVSDWIDVTFAIRSGMVHWPDNPDIRVEKMLDMTRGDVCNVTTLSLGSHTGTHMDAPLHFIRDGISLDRMPIDATVGPARVIQVNDRESVKVKHLESERIKPGERVLFRTRNSAQKDWVTRPFNEEFIFISKEAAQFLAEKRVRTVGVDYLSVGGFKKDGIETHHALLGAGIWIVEGLDLSRIKAGRYDLLCLPLKVLNSDGAPCRAFLRPRG